MLRTRSLFWALFIYCGFSSFGHAAISLHARCVSADGHYKVFVQRRVGASANFSASVVDSGGHVVEAFSSINLIAPKGNSSGASAYYEGSSGGKIFRLSAPGRQSQNYQLSVSGQRLNLQNITLMCDIFGGSETASCDQNLRQ